MALAARNLIRDRARLGLSVVGVALAIALILILNGLVAGMNRQISAYLDNTPGSLVLLQTGASGTDSVVPASTAAAARRVEGVKEALPVIEQYAVLDLDGAKQFVYVVGYDPALGGGPWALREGRQPAAADEVVMDGVLADRRGLGVGDRFGLMGRTLTVVGLSAGTTTWMTSYLFMRLEDAQAIFGMPEAVTMVLVSPADGTSEAAARQRLDELQGVDPMAKSELIARTRRAYLDVFAAPLQLMAGIATLIGALIVGMVVYAATVERQREYGVLKAIGTRNRLLYEVVGIQALVSALAGSGLGLLFGLGAVTLITTLRPQFLIVIEPTAAALALGAGLSMAALAAFIPARLVARLAPAEVFRR